MTSTRTGSARRRTWLAPGPPGRVSTVAALDTGPVPRRHSGRRAARAAAAGLGSAALAAAAIAKRATLAASLGQLSHAHWMWIPAALMLESASMAAFAAMQRQLLVAGGTSIGVRPMLATTYAANALSVSVPVAGPALGTAFTVRRFTRQGADAPLASWSLLAGGVVSSAAAALIVAGGGLASGNIVVIAAAMASGLLAVAALVLVGAVAHRPRLRCALERPAARALRHGSRLCRRPVSDPRQVIRAWADRLGSLRLTAAGWSTVTGLAMANWLADVAVLGVSIRAVGAAVPWHLLLLVYGSGIAAQSLNITPGGLGITEGTLCLTLVAAGVRASQALAAVLLYRLVSLWLVALAGWSIFLWLRHHRTAGRAAARDRTLPSESHPSRSLLRPGDAAAEPARLVPAHEAGHRRGR